MPVRLPSSAMTGELPKRIGHYVPLSKLGQGGMGVVYCARHEREPSRLVALKILSQGATCGREETGKRFQREARSLQGLPHPKSVTPSEAGVSCKKTFF